MEPYNVKIITYPDLTKQYRIYHNTIGTDDLSIPVRPHKKGERNPFDGKVCKEILVDIKDYKNHVDEVSIKRTKKKVYDYAKSNEWEWFVTFTFSPDKVNRYDLPFGEKEQDGKYLLSLPFDRGKKRPSGFISGQNVYNLFSDLTIGYHDSLDFLQLPIPFACVAADMFHREEIVMKGGNLVQAMRASMAIPGVFTPVRTGDRVLVDGGILNNFPTDVARELGAEIVIGVDVQADLMKEDKLESVSGVIPQIINLLCMNKHEANVKLADLVIRPDMKGYTAASFSARSIDSLLARGKVAALQQWSEIMRVKELIGEAGNVDNEIPKARQPEKIAIRNVIIRGLSLREEG